MDNVTVKFPNYTVGPDAIPEIPKYLERHWERVLVVGGKTAMEKSKEKIERAFRDGSVKDFEFMWYGGECTYGHMERVKETFQAKGFDLILGVGGGKALDTAKGAAERAGAPVMTVPTIASTCAATTALSIVYTEAGDFADLYYLDNTPLHIFIDTAIIAESPWKYLWAGIGDTMAKYYEVDINLRGKKMDHSVLLAKQISLLCAEPMFEHGVKALEDCKRNLVSPELREVILNNIVSTGLVSLLVGQANNGSAAHGVFYGMTALEEVEKNHLHGELVAYGILVMLMMDDNEAELRRLYPLYKEMGWPTCLGDLNLKDDETLLSPVIDKALENPDTKKPPFEVTRELLWSAIRRLERFRGE